MFVKNSLGGKQIVPAVIQKIKQAIQEMHENFQAMPVDRFLIDDGEAKEILEVSLLSAAAQQMVSEHEQLLSSVLTPLGWETWRGGSSCAL